MPGFNDIIGQDQIREHLENAIIQDKVSHAYIIVGERYAGKEFIARVFAQALLCEKETGVPCGECHSCKQALSNNNPDIIKVTHEKPNVISVDDIRVQVNEDVLKMPYGGKKKVYIINEAEKMNPQAQNALLKTFEEPPEYAVILLLVTNEEELLPTIRSRAVTLNMKPVADKIVKKYLMEEVKIPDYKADIAVSFSQGNFGKAKMLIMNEDFDKMRTEAVSLLKHINEMDAPSIMEAINKIKEYKYDELDYLDFFSVWYRDVLLFKATNDVNDLVFKQEIQSIKAVAKRTSYEGIDDIVRALETAKIRIKAKANFETCMTLLLEVIKGND